MREFHAQPLPMGEDALPPKKTKPVTIPEPFQLELDERGVKRLQEFSQKVFNETFNKICWARIWNWLGTFQMYM